MRFEWITTLAELDRLRADWTRLEDAHPGPGAVFRTWEWQATWWRHLGDDASRRRALRVLVARDDAGIARAILPMYVEDAPVAPFVERRRLAFLGDGVVGSDYLGLIGSPDLRVDMARRAAKDPMLADVDWVDLTDFVHDDPMMWAIAGALPEGQFEEVQQVHRYRCPYANLGAHDRKGYYASRPEGFGSQLTRRRKSLEKQKGYRVEILTAPDAVTGAMDAFFRLHRAAWLDRGGTDAITDERVEAFHRESARLLAERGFARMALMHIGGTPVAAAYGFLRGDRFDYYQAGLLPEWRGKSAGTVLLGAIIDHCYESGVRELDFLRGEEPYKRIWADRIRDTSAVRAVSTRARARLAAGVNRALVAIKQTARRTLPAETTARLRNLLARRSA